MSSANLFGKPSSDVQDGDRADAQLSILGATSPSDETLDTVEEGFIDKHDGCILGRFGGVLVGISPLDSGAIAQWLENSFESDELVASLGIGEGVLQAEPPRSESNALRLDFRSPAILETLIALATSHVSSD